MRGLVGWTDTVAPNRGCPSQDMQEMTGRHARNDGEAGVVPTNIPYFCGPRWWPHGLRGGYGCLSLRETASSYPCPYFQRTLGQHVVLESKWRKQQGPMGKSATGTTFPWRRGGQGLERKGAISCSPMMATQALSPLLSSCWTYFLCLPLPLRTAPDSWKNLFRV